MPVCSQPGATTADKAEAFISWIEDLKEKMEIPIHLDVIQKQDIPQIIKWAMKEANPLYPVPVLMTRNELERFYYMIADWKK
jgi:alcohol dehydrogenase class IV